MRARALLIVIGVLASVAGPSYGAERTAADERPPSRASVLDGNAESASPDDGYTATAAGRHFVRVEDKVRDVRDVHGDLVRASLRYGASRITLRAELRRVGSIKTSNWRRGDTSLIWWVDTNGDNYDNYLAAMSSDGHEGLAAATFDYDRRTCTPTPHRKGDVFTLQFRRSCWESPYRMRLAAAMFYDRNPDSDSSKSIQLDVAPAGVGWSPWVYIPPLPTRTSITASVRKLIHGDPVGISGTVEPMYEDVPMHLYRRAHGTKRWERVGRTSSWSYTLSITPRRPMDFHFRFPGNAAWQPSRSRSVTVDVAMKVEQDAVDDTYRPLGSVVEATGRVRPANPGGTVALQRRTADGWKTVKTGKVNSENLYTLRTTPKSSRAFTYRVRAASDGIRSAGFGERFRMLIYSAKITKVEPGDPVAEAQNLNSEYVAVKNKGRVPILLDSWGLASNRLQVTIPSAYGYTGLRPGDGVRIHTGSGEARTGHIYLGLEVPFWPAAGIAGLYDVDDYRMDEIQYGLE